MNNFSVSILSLCLIKLDELFERLNFTFVQSIAACKQLEQCCFIYKEEFDRDLPTWVDEIRSSDPFIHLSLSQETFVYRTFAKMLKLQ